MPLNDIHRIVLANLISSVGSGMQFMFNIWLSYQLSGSGLGVAGVLIIATLPSLLLTPFLGVLVDRYDRRRVAMLMDLLRAMALLLLAALSSAGQLTYPMICGLVFVLALGDRMFWPAQRALLREAAGDKALLPANARLSLATQTGGILGGAAGGLLLVTQPSSVLLVNALSFLLSLALLSTVRFTPPPRTVRPLNAANVALELKEGAQAILQRPAAAAFYAYVLFLSASTQLMNLLVVPFTQRILHADARAFAWIETAMSVGSVLAGVYIVMAAKTMSTRVLMTFSMLIMAAGLLMFGLSRDLPWAMLGYFLVGAALSSYAVFSTEALKRIDVNVQGRVHSAFSSISGATSLLVTLVSGWALTHTTPNTLYLALAGAALLAALAVPLLTAHSTSSPETSP